MRKTAIFFGIAGLAVFVGCGGGGGSKSVPSAAASTAASAAPGASASAGASATPTASPTPTPSPTPIPLSASPASVAFGGVNGTQQITVTDKGFTGTITAVSNDTSIVLVAPASLVVRSTTSPASTGVFTATSIGIGLNLSGSTTITISDGTLTIALPVTVSQTGGSITALPPRPKGPS